MAILLAWLHWCERDTAYFESMPSAHAQTFSLLPGEYSPYYSIYRAILLPVSVEECQQGKNSVALISYTFFPIFFFFKMFFQNFCFFSKIFFQNLFLKFFSHFFSIFLSTKKFFSKIFSSKFCFLKFFLLNFFSNFSSKNFFLKFFLTFFSNFFSKILQNFLFTKPFFYVIVRQLIKNSQFRKRHCTHMNAVFSTEIERKVSYAAQEESRFHHV